jgi:hypothetical protein
MSKVPSSTRPPRVGLPQEIREQLKHLRPRSSDVRIAAIVCASDALDKLKHAIENSSTAITVGTAKRICRKLKHAATSSPRNPNCVVRYDDRTIQATTTVLIVLSKLALAKTVELNSDSSEKRPKSTRRRFALALTCLDTLSAICERAEHDSSWRMCMEYIGATVDSTGIDMNSLLKDAHGIAILGVIQQKLAAAVKDALRDGKIAEAVSVFESARNYKAFRQAIAENLTEVLKKDSAILPTPIQEWIMSTVGIERDSRSVNYANPAEAPEIRQAAGLLLQLWDNTAESPVVKEAFDRFRTLCEKHFHLYLKGQPGEVAAYDNRVHEVTGSGSVTVRLTRPWVEFIDPPRSSVVIRALAASA